MLAVRLERGSIRMKVRRDKLFKSKTTMAISNTVFMYITRHAPGDGGGGVEPIEEITRELVRENTKRVLYKTCMKYRRRLYSLLRVSRSTD